MNKKQAAESFAELGHERRIAIILELVRAGEAGLTTGELAQITKIANSTLSHHLQKLELAKLIYRKKDKQKIICSVNFMHLKKLSNYLLERCC